MESFRLNRRTEQEPSYFEAVFADETVQYRYGFEVDEKRVHREWLYQKGNKRKAKEVELFLRDGDEYELHPKFSVGKEVVAKKMVRDNALLLSVAAQFNESVSVEIMGWLANTTIVLGSSDERIWEMAIAQIDDPSMKRRIVEFARFADFGIDDIRKVDNTVISSHQQYDEEGNATKTGHFPVPRKRVGGYDQILLAGLSYNRRVGSWQKAGCRRVRLENAPSVDQSHHRAVQFQSDKSQECTVDFHDT